MSGIETHKGKLVPMTLNGRLPEERAESACKVLGFEKQDYHTSWLDCLQDEGYRKVYIRGSIIYQVKDHELDPNGYAQVTKNDDHSLDYCMSFHNGGCSFDEALDSAMNRESVSNEDDD